jgi:Photosynthesis system II assembly factor YCF48
MERAMPADDREQQFERGLARHLRGGSPDAACPDAEILAAYHERTLSPEELEQWKKHIVGCARCQETMALVESSELALKEEWQEVVAPVGYAKERVMPQMSANVSGEQQAAAGAAKVVGIQDGSSGKLAAAKRRRILRWTAPAGAIAAALILWLSLRPLQHSSTYRPAPNETQLAENRNSQAELSQNEPKAADEGNASTLTAGKTMPGDATAVRKDALPQLAPRSPQLAPPSSQMRAPSPSVAGRAAGGYAGINAAIAQDKLDKQPQSERDEKKLYRANIPPQKNERSGEGGGSAERVTPSPAGGKIGDQSGVTGAGVTGGAVSANSVGFGVSQSAPAPAKPAAPAAAKTQATDKAKEEMLASVTETVEVTSASPSVDTSSAAQQTTTKSQNELALNGRNYTNLMALRPGVVSNLIVAAKGKNIWRVGAAGLIERSSDSGKTWKAQESGVTSDLISGVAPEEKICWVAGKAGTLLLTRDGGKHWKIVKTPVGEDLVRVQASDAHHAKIWSAGNHAAYETEDAGSSWAPVGLIN